MTERCPTLRLVDLTVKRCTKDADHISACHWIDPESLTIFVFEDTFQSKVPLTVWYRVKSSALDQTEPIRPYLAVKETDTRIVLLDRASTSPYQTERFDAKKDDPYYHRTLDEAVQWIRLRHWQRVEQYEQALREAEAAQQSFFAQFIDPRE